MREFKKISFDQFANDLKNYCNAKQLYEELKLPERGTSKAAGYDFHSPYAFTLDPGQILKIPTGIKASMDDDDFLMIVVRSSTGVKHNVRMCNQVGIIDADYYNNEQNEGHIWIALQNEGSKPFSVEQGECVAQGIFLKYLLTDTNDSMPNTRKGGFGSTNMRGDMNE